MLSLNTHHPHMQAHHLPLLRNILHSGQEAIARIYGVAPQQLRVFVHYQPQFYHFHVHFTVLSPGTLGCEAERAHLLQDVIRHLEASGDHYQKCVLMYKLPRNDALCLRLCEHKRKAASGGK